MSFVKEFIRFLKARGKLWMLPIILVLILIGFLLVAGQTSLFSAFIYTLF
ncbi:MAG: DUF5989 family protein [Bacteroidia bacterium]|nr:DUF5989 family protein [Bacteroidia bacterium]